MKRIYFTVDHTLFRECLALLLERRMGCECIQAGSFAEAHWVLDHLQGEVDLAIIDLDLSDGDGGEIVERLRELRFLLCWCLPRIGAWSGAPALWRRARTTRSECRLTPTTSSIR
jgi:CheY-like chemotaxis protein